MSDSDFEVIGTGINVYEQAEPTVGKARWLDSPAAVMELVMSGEIGSTIGISRGGTTTFMAPALASGIAGLITLQGAPESHLGILSREFGIPCVMSVSFTTGIQTDRGETVPADGTTLQLDLADPARGHVLARSNGA
jgi:hypothetical protein